MVSSYWIKSWLVPVEPTFSFKVSIADGLHELLLRDAAVLGLLSQQKVDEQLDEAANDLGGGHLKNY